MDREIGLSKRKLCRHKRTENNCRDLFLCYLLENCTFLSVTQFVFAEKRTTGTICESPQQYLYLCVQRENSICGGTWIFFSVGNTQK